MTLIPLQEDRRTIARGFRKAPLFAFLNEGQITVQKNTHRQERSPAFFEYFKTLGVDTLYIKDLGYKTFLKLHGMGVSVYLVTEAERYNRIRPDELLLLDPENAEAHCTMGHR